MHARSGGTLEVMGLLLGKVAANTMIVMDSFALPVEGTETRVNAQAQAYEYMTAYIEAAKQVCTIISQQKIFVRTSIKIYNCIINFVFRLVDKKMPLVGITAILDMDVGCRVLMYPLRCSTRISKSRLLLLLSIP